MIALGGAYAPAHAGVRELAREKAAAISIMRVKAAKQIAALAQDRLFGAFLNATTQGESARLKLRIESAFKTINDRFGIKGVSLTARDGTIVSRVAGRARAAGGETMPVIDAALSAGFAIEAMEVATLVTFNGDEAGYAVSHVSPVVWHGNKVFVLRGDQGVGAYRAVMTSGVGRGQYVALIGETGEVLAEAGSNPSARRTSNKLSVAGLTFDGIRRAIKGSASAGDGEVVSAKKRIAVGYQSVGPWTVVAVEEAAVARRCKTNGARLCG